MPGRVFPRYVLTQPWEYPAMNLKQRFLRLGLAAVLLGSLGACTVVPAYPSSGYYRAPAPAYVETYPTYGYPSANVSIMTRAIASTTAAAGATTAMIATTTTGTAGIRLSRTSVACAAISTAASACPDRSA